MQFSIIPTPRPLPVNTTVQFRSRCIMEFDLDFHCPFGQGIHAGLNILEFTTEM